MGSQQLNASGQIEQNWTAGERTEHKLFIKK